MNTIKISTKLNQALIDYLCTTFDVNKDGSEAELAYEIRRSFERSKALFNGPFLELTLPYETGSSLNQLCDESVLSKKLLELTCFQLNKPIAPDSPLYVHQEKSIRKLCREHRSIVISAGTGSGKTECFLFPIIDDLILDTTPGVRAILVYPLNALVNDQLDRLRTILKDTNITFGRFTGELPNDANRATDTLPNEIISRNEIREEGRIPQILITNYAMLEYLLLRPEDSVLFQTGLWKYLVLDEAHTYSGAQGIEVALLIRRLKERLNKKPGDMQCIATSATLVNDDTEAAAEFAKNLFGEDYSSNDIVFGKVKEPEVDPPLETLSPLSEEVYLHLDFPNLIEELRKENPNIDSIALWMNEIGLVDGSVLENAKKFDDIQSFLNDILISNFEVRKLRKYLVDKEEPVEASNCASYLFPNLDAHDSIQALYHLIELGSLARSSEDSIPLIPAKYHLFARPPQGIWVCLNPKCPESDKEKTSDQKWSKMYSTPHETCDSCGAMVYPINICRQCGQIFIATQKEKNSFSPAVATTSEESQKQYFTWKPIQENFALAEEIEDEDEINSSLEQQFRQEGKKICLNCGREINLCNCESKTPSVLLYDIQAKEKKSKGSNESAYRWKPIELLDHCPRCGSSSKGGTEIATPISLQGTAPLANLTYELYRLLPPSNQQKMKKLPGEGRKLLTFNDSRQGAARFASFLQDVANKQNYRHIIPKAIDAFWETNKYAPSFNALEQTSADMALKNKIIQNDSDAESFWRTSNRLFSRGEREEAKKWISSQILGEITTGMRQRQSLESLGLVCIEYFDEETKNICDFPALAKELGLSVVQTNTLIKHLLDQLRYIKAIVLPPYVSADDPVFGPNKGNPRLIRQGSTNYGQIPWIGKTPRQQRRKYIKKVLEENRHISTDEAVESMLTILWDFLIEQTDIFEGSIEDGFQLRLNRLFFQKDFDLYQCQQCLRLSSAGSSLPCPSPNCYGKYEKIENKENTLENYYYQLFQDNLIPVRVEEHTAQLDPDLGRKYQDLFKSGQINILSCSTTFELGIDLGDLQSVAMSNVPPTIANYRQRSGRAGRRTNGTAFILTWASGRPHDQIYYGNPAEIIGGNVAIPYIFLENPFIIRRHTNAILLSQFLRYRRSQGTENLRTAGDFFDNIVQTDPIISFLDEWLEKNRSLLKDHLQEFQDLLPIQENNYVEKAIENFQTDLYRIDHEQYQPISNYYIEQINKLADRSKDTTVSDKNRKQVMRQQDYYQRLLIRLRDEYLINFLSSKGVLPSYSFPLHTVELMLPMEARRVEHLRLERDLSQAIREYAPGSEIVADKRVWRSQRPVFWKDTPKQWEYIICSNCHNLIMSEDAGVQIPSLNYCPICGDLKFGKRRIFVEPDGFMADKKSGKPAKQYINVEPSLMRSAILPLKNIDEQQIGDLVFLAYEREGKLLYVNEGKYGRGFNFPLEGFGLSEPGKDEKKNFALGHIRTTDTLHIRFSGNELVKVRPPYDESFWLSLMYALIHAASHALQIERNDIDGVLSPRKHNDSWEQTIVLYDNVPGGAGHVKAIRDRFIKVLEDAIRVLNCPDCSPETSCHHCLRDYRNQHFHDLLVRKDALKFLEVVFANLNPIKSEINGACNVIAGNQSTWLLRSIENAKQTLDLAIEYLTLGHPSGENFSWFDTLKTLINKGCSINLNLLKLPDSSPAGLSIARELQVLLDRGMKIWGVDNLPKWQIVIDYDDPTATRAISTADDQLITLGSTVGANQLVTTSNILGVQKAFKDWENIKKQQLNIEDFSPPDSIKVINLYASPSKYVSVESLFEDVFNKPLKGVLVNDPYLLDRERIFLLEPYIRLATLHNELKTIIVHTKRNQRFAEQQQAEEELNQKFSHSIEFKHNPLEHDRYILLTRVDGEQARIIFGRGLDFIQPDGSIRPTFIIIQDPLS
ncbi:MAG: DEAD/DEAH box helicase [Candidatus Methanofastidiosa archaeon]|nr:DEAD/DEAH box helicase [Candidatus Methanofastidiosa archaeon]